VCNPPHVADGLVEANADEEDDGELVQLCIKRTNDKDNEVSVGFGVIPTHFS
jgi:hypothetical protein